MFDALQRIVRRVQRDAGLRAVARQVVRQQRRRGIADHAGRFSMRRNNVADHRKLLLRPAYAPRFLGQRAKGLRARVLVHQMQIDVEQHVLFVDTRHDMRVDQLLVKGSV